IQAAVLRVKLKGLDAANKARQEIAKMYSREIHARDLILPSVAEHCEHVFHQYVVRSKQREALRAYLLEQGVQTGVHYPYALHQQPGYRTQVRVVGELERTEALIQEIVSLPVYPELSKSETLRVAEVLNRFHE
ncbi:MAG: DegT/DnrJ/EryC1/StrS family aminotransferase, partial [Myxococcota bacterium]|nr:DegT/DnrJ/EryC1/StrS family aminotransferase [Myxococcota bacterium]